MPLSALLAIERGGRLAQGVQDRGYSLPENWTCEVVDRKSGGQDVYYRSPEGVRFRSDLEVYRHLGLKVLGIAKGKTSSKCAEEPLSTGLDVCAEQAGQQVSVQASKQAYEALTPISSVDIKDLPDILQEVPIKCNLKRDIWHLRDNSVECTDTGCISCLDKPKEERTMTRCGAGGFGKHSGLSADSIWKSAFKVDVTGFEGMTVEAFVNQHGYSFRPSAKAHQRSVQDVTEAGTALQAGTNKASRPKRIRPAPAPQDEAQTKARHVNAAAKERLHTGMPSCSITHADPQFEAGHQPPVLSAYCQPVAEAQGLSSVLNHPQAETGPVKSISLGLPTMYQQQDMPNGSMQSQSNPQAAAGQSVLLLQSELAAVKAAHAAEIAALQATVAVLNAQANVARTEYLQELQKNTELNSIIYDLKTRAAKV